MTVAYRLATGQVVRVVGMSAHVAEDVVGCRFCGASVASSIKHVTIHERYHCVGAA